MRSTHVREGAAIDGLTNPTSNHRRQRRNHAYRSAASGQRLLGGIERQRRGTHHRRRSSRRTIYSTTDTQRAGHPAGMFTTSTSRDARTLSVAEHSNLLPAAHSVSRLGGRKPTSSPRTLGRRTFLHPCRRRARSPHAAERVSARLRSKASTASSLSDVPSPEVSASCSRWMRLAKSSGSALGRSPCRERSTSCSAMTSPRGGAAGGGAGRRGGPAGPAGGGGGAGGAGAAGGARRGRDGRGANTPI